MTGSASKARADTRIEIAEVNGAPGLLVFSGAALSYIGTFAIMNERIQAIHAFLNPDKLAYIQRQVRENKRPTLGQIDL